MESVDILYHTDDRELREYNAHSFAKRLTDKTGVNIKIRTCYALEILPLLGSDPNYQFVIIHLCYGGASGYEIAKQVRQRSNAILVAESLQGGIAFGREEVLQHFDEYIGPRLNEDNLEALLRKYGFVHS